MICGTTGLITRRDACCPTWANTATPKTVCLYFHFTVKRGVLPTKPFVCDVPPIEHNHRADSPRDFECVEDIVFENDGKVAAVTDLTCFHPLLSDQ